MPYASAEHDGKLDIYYEDDGAGDPLVLIGGLTSTAEVWSFQLPDLVPHFRVIRPDNRGSGRTRLVQDDGVRSIPRFAGDVLALIDALGLEKVHLCGASMGGFIVQEFAARYPDRLRSLTVMCSHPGGTMAVPADPNVMAEFAKGSSGEASTAERRRTLEIVFNPQPLEQAGRALTEYEAAKQRFPHSAAELAARGKGVAAFDVSTRLPGIPTPTLVMCGDGDLIVPPANSERIAASIPGAELVKIPETGHVFFTQKPEALNRALVNFLKRH